jgi:hypothetical protein
MRDGNKESVKEFLSAFRTLSSIAMSTILIIAGLRARHELLLTPWAFYSSIILLGASIVACIYLFFLVFPKIHEEEDNIIYLPDVRTVAVVASSSFFVGNILLIASLLI